MAFSCELESENLQGDWALSQDTVDVMPKHRQAALRPLSPPIWLSYRATHSQSTQGSTVILLF